MTSGAGGSGAAGTAATGGAAGSTGGAGPAGTGGTVGSTGGGAAAGTGGAAGSTGGAAGTAPLFPCIGGWPSRPAGGQKAAPLSVQPQTLWTVDLPVKGTTVTALMAATGSGVAFSFANILFIYDGQGNRVASVTGSSSGQNAAVSTPVTGVDGSVYFADSVFAYRLDGGGQTVWKTTIGGGGSQPAGGVPLLDGNGRLYFAAADGGVRVLRAADGMLLSTFSLGGTPRYIYAGVGDVLFMDRERFSTTGSGKVSEGVFSTVQGTWVGEITVGPGRYPPSSFVGYDIGVVTTAYLDTDAETTEVDIHDSCGRFRWRVPGDHAIPLAITFDDDLIVMDRAPTGGGQHSFALRRFSRDGALVAGPVSVPDTFCGRAFVGADDTFYYTGGASDGYRLRAFDSSLKPLWTVPFPYCSDAAVLNSDGKIFTANGTGGKLAAVQTPSPGPAPVSWSQVDRDARATRWLAP